ncbi:MAG TPA: hypothetical protein VD886_00770 [Herpetosiphonaceae bacterium]|nr:hypothetical protein [Herpetosiphonaceae bacterium]
MYRVPHNVARPPAWPLALLWLGIAVLNIAWANQIYPLLYSITRVANSSILLMSSGISVVSGLPAIILQWLVLRRFFPGMDRWVPLFGAIAVAEWLLQEPLLKATGNVLAALGVSTSPINPFANAAVDALVAGTLAWTLVPGLAGWWLFRPLARRAWLWPWALLLGRLGQISATLMMLWPILDSGRMNLTVYSRTYEAATLLGAALQAAALVLFLRERARPPAPGPLAGSMADV